MSNWYEGLIGKQKIEYMFNGDFPIDNVILDYVGIYDRVIKCRFLTNYKPSKIPEKWKKKQFNTISFTLGFTDVERFSITGDNLFKKEGVLIVNYDENLNSINFKNQDVSCYVLAGYIFLNEIETLNI